ncbi:hypothetical protein V1264_019769 [Littorina saxatilis]|uniref:Dynein heavy chain linker domain-containing protein n=1 Tax=Littorina saxatilis TaxID=31220 RepID=A0AAN9BDE0_9CAEN
MASDGYANGVPNGAMNSEVDMTPRLRSKLGTIGPDGFPVLPPIRTPAKPKEDPYAKSRLRTHRLANQNKALLMKILQESAMKAADESHYFNELKPREENKDFPEYPPEMMSKERRIRLNYQYLKGSVESGPVTPMQQQWAEHIIRMIPEHLRNKPELREVLNELFAEVHTNFNESMKKSMVQHVLIKPDVKGLEGEVAGPPPAEPQGLDFSQPWHEAFLVNREDIRDNLHLLHPSMQTVLRMCQATLGNLVLVDVSTYRSNGPMEFDNLKNNVILDLEKTEEKLMHSWYPGVINVFTDKNNFTGIKNMESFYNSVTTLISNQLKELLVRTIDGFVDLFEEENHLQLPILKMELTFDDQMMQFYPPVSDLEELVLFVVKQVTNTMQKVATVQSWLAGGNTLTHTDAIVAQHILDTATKRLKERVAEYFKKPQEHLQSFIDRYDYIVNGEALTEIHTYMEDEHTFAEFTVQIEKYRALASEIMGLPSIEHYDMIRLDCEDLKVGLAEASRGLADELLSRVSADHRRENENICEEFKVIQERALKIPETSEELQEMVTFVEQARTVGMIKLNERIKDSKDRLAYLIDVFMFTPKDIELNCEVLTWPTRINPVFDDNDVLVESSKQKSEKQLNERREKVMLELEKLRQRVDEFNDYGELDMMQQYVQDVGKVQRRIADIQEQIVWINKEEALFKYPVSVYPDVDDIASQLDPFMRLFNVVLKWQRAEKKWMDGMFLELNSEAIEGEVDEYTRDLYKIQKQFNSKVKKLQIEREERDREKKRKRRMVEEDGEAPAEEEDDDLQIPQAVNVCNTVMDNMRDFKEIVPVISIMCNPGIRERHWTKMSDIAGFDLTPDTGTTLRKVLKLELDSFMEQFEMISGGASKEFSLEKAMKKMMDEWEGISFSLIAYRDTGISILASVDDIQTILDDQIVKTQTMRGSPFIKPFEKEIKVQS